MKRLAIVGASGHGLVAADTAELCGWDEIDFFDDYWPKRQLNGVWSIVGGTSALIDRLCEYGGVAVAIGSNLARFEVQNRLEKAGAKLVTIIHPSACISRYASLGEGSSVLAGAILNAGAAVGRGTILNTGCSVDHDCILDDFVHISPGARLAGNVRIGTRSWIGIGAVVRQGIYVGNDVIVGAGAVVVNDVANGLTVVGTPAKPIC